MNAPVLAAAVALLAKPSESWVVLEEHQVEGRIPDLVIGRLDVPALRARLRGGWRKPLNLTELKVLRSLRPDRPATSAHMARRLRLSDEHVRSVLLGLARDRFARRTPEGGFYRTAALAPVMNYVVTIELKRSEWRRAIIQARAHQSFADEAYVAFDAAYTPRFRRALSAFRGLGIGLLSVDSETQVFRKLLHSRRSALRTSLAASLNSERVLRRLLRAGVAMRLPQSKLPGASGSTVRLVGPRLLGPVSKTLGRRLAAVGLQSLSSSQPPPR